MIDILAHLQKMGVEIERPSKPDFSEPTMPQNAYNVVKQYQKSIDFDLSIQFKPQYATGLEGDSQTLPLESLWGIEAGDDNIEQANETLNCLDADPDLYSIGLCYGSHHICISNAYPGVYLYTNGIEDPVFKLFENIDDFFRALAVEEDEPMDDPRLGTVKVNLRF
ncbi:hypothetical protein [Photobacterium galatheae]|uniref:Knr4/Smi1-like domain-containing protein n=1 Tax=Photobacterium galatheae TaxID=1654360 RepID=A0A066RM08_9GAMM|nr:hypothetical protein [Photobacterium galatheae]KDM91485.1 hypothetical protein EA58_10690 [Photobacterium galatheae]MCM0149558.1 hypothetical protein [Photobacterium galatheae]